MLVLSHRFLDELPELCTPWQAEPAADPALVVLNERLVAQLDLDATRLGSPAGIRVLCGNTVPEGASPVALGYAGHQFGNYSPRLGDGRALLLGEVTDADGRVLDVHLKGSGRTPFARGGDGRATVGPMLREYLVSEALHALGVSTTCSLAVVTTGDSVRRDRPEPGAVLTRIAASHLRVGTFEYAVHLGGYGLVARLADHAIERHHPSAASSEHPYRSLLDSVIEAQAELVARWMLVGFIHGVMNTDNMTISGEGIDYGPCAFLDHYDPATVFSSIDHAGRYAYGNQPPIATWNLARFAETLLGLLAEDPDEAIEVATDLVKSFPARFEAHWQAGMARKLGLAGLPEGDASLFEDLPSALHADGLDWTTTFRSLAAGLRDAPDDPTGGRGGVAREALRAWLLRWQAHVAREGRPRHEVADAMDAVNPCYIPRNHLVHDALEAATAGELGPFHELESVLREPYTERRGLERFASPASTAFAESFRTFCGT